MLGRRGGGLTVRIGQMTPAAWPDRCRQLPVPPSGQQHTLHFVDVVEDGRGPVEGSEVDPPSADAVAAFPHKRCGDRVGLEGRMTVAAVGVLTAVGRIARLRRVGVRDRSRRIRERRAASNDPFVPSPQSTTSVRAAAQTSIERPSGRSSTCVISGGPGVARYVGRPVMPAAAGSRDGSGRASANERKIRHAVSSGVSTITGQTGVVRTIAATAGSFPGSQTSSPPGVGDQ